MHKRKLVRSQWPEIRKLARNLITGRQKRTIKIEAAERSALCPLGINWFRDRLHISHKSTLSGRIAAVLMNVEPQLGFVIFEAAHRSGIWARGAGHVSQHDTAPAVGLRQIEADHV